MKSLYITFRPLIDGDGISKKVKAQHQAFIKNGLDMELSYLSVDNGIRSYIIGEDKLILGNKLIAKLKHNLLYSLLYDKLVKHIKKNNIEFIYIRYTSDASPSYIKFLKKIKSLGVIIFIEIPTYPYDGEINATNYYQSFNIEREKHYRKQLYKVVDRIVTFSSDDEIYRIKCINISNAIDFNAIELREESPTHDYVKFIAVAALVYWHGYDRIIEAIGEYYKNWDDSKRVIYIDILGGGGGGAYSSLLNQIEKLNLGKYVKLHGVKIDKELTELFKDADIGIGSLGRHRNGIFQMKALKNVEYAARGIPFIYSETNPDFEDKEYIYKVAADESPIDITKILEDFDYRKFVPQSIRNSVAHLSWENQMGIVVDSLKDL